MTKKATSSIAMPVTPLEAALGERFRVVQGDILQDPGIPFIPVNCEPGVMGKGLALAFARKYPGIDREHYRILKTMGMGIGRPCILYRCDNKPLPKPLVFFPTKHKWRNPSAYAWIFAGLESMSRILDRVEIDADAKEYQAREGCEGMLYRPQVELAVPALGCGEGGLDFAIIGPMIAAWSACLTPRFRVTLYHTQESDSK